MKMIDWSVLIECIFWVIALIISVAIYVFLVVRWADKAVNWFGDTALGISIASIPLLLPLVSILVFVCYAAKMGL